MSLISFPAAESPRSLAESPRDLHVESTKKELKNLKFTEKLLVLFNKAKMQQLEEKKFASALDNKELLEKKFIEKYSSREECQSAHQAFIQYLHSLSKKYGSQEEFVRGLSQSLPLAAKTVKAMLLPATCCEVIKIDNPKQTADLMLKALKTCDEDASLENECLLLQLIVYQNAIKAEKNKFLLKLDGDMFVDFQDPIEKVLIDNAFSKRHTF